jgi:hypothetical protein
MGRVKRRWTRLTAWIAAATLIALPGTTRAQLPGTIPGMGSMNTLSSQPITSAGTGSQTADSPSSPYTSEVSFIDSAIPTSQAKLLFDANYQDHRPTRAEYLFARSGVPGSPGWWVPEKNVDWQELTSYIEIAYQDMFSGFLNLPTRWVNPDVNPNAWGMADIDFGVKVALLSTSGLTTSIEVTGTVPTREGPGLSTSHYSVEPGFLFYFQPMEMLALEGEVRYWKALDGNPFGGDFVRYGLGLSVQTGSIIPVLEVVGWTLLGGEEMVPMPSGYVIKSDAGEEIVNVMGGVRFSLGGTGDIYVGYGHSVTGDAWQHEFWRLEFRVKF